MRHLTSLLDLNPADVAEILSLAERLKSGLKNSSRPSLLTNYVMSQVFEKPSLRTRNSFEVAMVQLGGAGIFLTCQEAGLGGRESLPDIARVLSGYSDIITLRTFSQAMIEEFSQHSSCPVINALSDERHPCQALTDLLTVQEVFGSLNDRHLVFVGDGNNVAVSLALAAGLTGMAVTISSPQGYELPDDKIEQIRSRFPDAKVKLVTDPREAVSSADVVYTDVWASMGQEAEKKKRAADFADYCVNEDLMACAPASCKFMHDLPARRGLEVTDGVMDGPASIVFQQAENRMHLAKGLIAWLLDVTP